MPRLRVARILSCVAVAALVALPASRADAVVYSSNFDPVDFSGTATFDVSPSCLGFSGFVSNNGDPCTVTWLTAVITITNGTNSDTLNFAPLLPSAGVVENIFVQGGELAGVNSVPLGAITSVHSDPELNGPWWIEYSFTLSDDIVAQDGQFGLGVVHLYTGACTPTDIGAPICVPNLNPVSTAQVLNFTRVTAVPEPGSLALLLVAIGAWSTRRHLRRA